MVPDKIVIEITAEGYATTVLSGEETVIRKTTSMISAQEAENNEPGDWYDALERVMPEGYEESGLDLAEAIEECDMSVFEIASALRMLGNSLAD